MLWYNPLCFYKCSIQISQDKDKLILFRGQFTISPDLARRGTFYKYLVVKKGNLHYEELPEFPSMYRGYVNRFLKIPERHVEPGGK